MTAAKHKRRVGSSSVSQSRYRFSNPILLYPETLFSRVTVAEGVREEGERKRLKCSCLACVYFHPFLQSIRVSVLLHLEEGADSQAKLGCLSSSQESTPGSTSTTLWAHVEAHLEAHFFSALKARLPSRNKGYLRFKV